jgi:hypothetical protein
MMVGSIVALLGFMKLDTFRAACPWIVPLHIGFYLVHMAQVFGC